MASRHTPQLQPIGVVRSIDGTPILDLKAVMGSGEG
jgi:tRNA (Thr-GGU) A37 N-methylase